MGVLYGDIPFAMPNKNYLLSEGGIGEEQSLTRRAGDPVLTQLQQDKEGKPLSRKLTQRVSQYLPEGHEEAGVHPPGRTEWNCETI